ncbi:peptide chain release factor eRF subunit 2 [Galdieria sulphuraria]|uniref:Peptide chain release factor eRF subunit 2 n=1 Tax=Galdieria sulphuraria TaxID=130081 RepID=M2Y2R4_GALSU|nr:peptide chain release factor eRF subunit 2 [Galdieria sulphuraria]EME30233.1 peptide chain release factor eRF subunit 2 [Galdieria sulphuraria]|eukprot:XP_005706753.1 peptide chain release factor eRF subunit 2 [Galdieria sulphuraria]
MNPQAKEFVPKSFLSKDLDEPISNGEVDTETLPKKPLVTGFQESWEDNLVSSEEQSRNTKKHESDQDTLSGQLQSMSVQEPPKKIDEHSSEGTWEEEEYEQRTRNANFDSSSRKHVNIVFIGHVDAGKSTVSGHILYLTGMVDDRTMEKFEREAKAKNRETWKYAWALDTTEQERAKGKTEECGRAEFLTEHKHFTILDAPGHKNFVPQMIGGATQADIAVLVISARKGEFETGFERGGQTREHAMLAKTAGVRQLIVAVNKMDDPSILNPDGTWNKARYDECCEKLLPFLKQIGWKPQDIYWIPISGYTGQNLLEKVDPAICNWYTNGPLLTILDELKPPQRVHDSKVRMPVTDKYKEMGTVVCGKLEAGVITRDQHLFMMPNRVEVVVDAIFIESTEVERAEPGDNVRIRIKGIEEEDIRMGFVLCEADALVQGSSLFDAQIMLLDYKNIICAGYSCVMHVHAAVEECTIEKLLAQVDRKTNQVVQKRPKFLKPGMAAIARMSVAQPVCILPFKEFPQLGRFILRDEGKTVAVGVIQKVGNTISAD